MLPASFMLRAALRNGRLWATWSMRNGVRTIYGPSPAICFTEMPIAAFLQAGKYRWKSGQAMSPFALVFPKRDLYQLGARPVIAGVSSDSSFSVYYDAAGNRMLPESILPSAEQFRHVTFDIGGVRDIDWTHEREWRWPYRGGFSAGTQRIQEVGIVSSWDEIPGLDFYRAGISGIGVIVETTRQAEFVVSDMLTLIDSGQAHAETFGFVLASNILPAPNHLQDPAGIAQAIESAMVNLDPYFSLSHEMCDEFSNRFSELVRQVEESAGVYSHGEFGGCWLWLHNNASPLTRALLQTRRAFVTPEGRYLASLYEFSDSRGLREREAMTSRLASMVREEFETSCDYFSVLHSDDPTAVPFYADGFDDEIGFFNFSWNA